MRHSNHYFLISSIILLVAGCSGGGENGLSFENYESTGEGPALLIEEESDTSNDMPVDSESEAASDSPEGESIKDDDESSNSNSMDTEAETLEMSESTADSATDTGDSSSPDPDPDPDPDPSSTDDTTSDTEDDSSTDSSSTTDEEDNQTYTVCLDNPVDITSEWNQIGLEGVPGSGNATVKDINIQLKVSGTLVESVAMNLFAPGLLPNYIMSDGHWGGDCGATSFDATINDSGVEYSTGCEGDPSTISGTFEPAQSPFANVHVGAPANGDWRLDVMSTANAGRIDSFCLEIIY